jgi:16S rRNA (cytidine1402-2'-O)-methyltransferase
VTGRLLIAATPIGNIDDASPRLRSALATADVIAAEDTRRLLNLLRALEVQPVGQVLSYFEGNETERTAELLTRLSAGATVLLVSDAGMPLVSDPGYRLVSAAYAAQIAVDVIPGPSAVLAALAVSGLPVERFIFEGFLPRKRGERTNAIASLREEPRAVVFFEAPHRLVECLIDCAEGFGASREIAVCRELTKTYQEVVRGTCTEVLEHFRHHEPRGEITIVVAGRSAPLSDDLSDAGIVELVRLEQSAGGSPNAAIAAVAKRIGLPRQQVYDLVLDAKQRSGDSAQP